MAIDGDEGGGGGGDGDGGGSGRGSSSSSGWELPVRQAVRQAIMAGDVRGAIETIRGAGYSRVSLMRRRRGMRARAAGNREGGHSVRWWGCIQHSDFVTDGSNAPPSD